MILGAESMDESRKAFHRLCLVFGLRAKDVKPARSSQGPVNSETASLTQSL